MSLHRFFFSSRREFCVRDSHVDFRAEPSLWPFFFLSLTLVYDHHLMECTVDPGRPLERILVGFVSACVCICARVPLFPFGFNSTMIVVVWTLEGVYRNVRSTTNRSRSFRFFFLFFSLCLGGQAERVNAKVPQSRESAWSTATFPPAKTMMK